MGISKRAISIVMVMFIVAGVFFSGCAAPKNNNSKKKIPPPTAGKTVRIGIALSPPGKGDKGTNDAALAGMTRASNDFGIEYKIINSGELVDEQETIRYLAENNFDLVIVVGYPMVKALREVAPDYPDINFAIIDDVVELPNVTSITFREQEGSFLAGALAATLTQSHNVGFIGGADMDLIHKYDSGFKQGVNYIDDTDKKNVKVLTSYLGVTINAFDDSQLGKNVSDSQLANGIDVIYHAARNSSQGIIDSAKGANKLVIGSDINQNDVAPGTVYASTVKKVDEVLYLTIQKLTKGELKHENVSYGFAEKGIDLEMAPGAPQDIIDKVNGIKDKIIKGQIQVTEKISDELNNKVTLKVNPNPNPNQNPNSNPNVYPAPNQNQSTKQNPATDQNQNQGG